MKLEARPKFRIISVLSMIIVSLIFSANLLILNATGSDTLPSTGAVTVPDATTTESASSDENSSPSSAVSDEESITTDTSPAHITETDADPTTVTSEYTDITTTSDETTVDPDTTTDVSQTPSSIPSDITTDPSETDNESTEPPTETDSSETDGESTEPPTDTDPPATSPPTTLTTKPPKKTVPPTSPPTKPSTVQTTPPTTLPEEPHRFPWYSGTLPYPFSPQDPVTNSPEQYSFVNLSLTTEQCLVLDLSQDSTLYASGSERLISPRLASRLMAAVLAKEKLYPDYMIFVPPFTSQDSRDRSLKNGDAYFSAAFLTNALLLEGSEIAMQSLITAVAGDVETFVKHMNIKAGDLNLSDTEFSISPFKNSNEIESAKFDHIPAVDLNPDKESQGTVSGISSLRDLGKIAKYALSHGSIRETVGKKNYNFLEAGRFHHFVNDFSAAWDSVTDLDGGLIACEPGEYSAFFTVGLNRDPEQLNYLALFCGLSVGTDPDLIVRRNLLNIRSIYEAMGNAYTRSQLVAQGEILAHHEEFAGQIFSPVALRDVWYTHPREIDILVSNNPIFRPKNGLLPPVEIGTAVGDLLYRLQDGSDIIVPIGSNINILATPLPERSFRAFYERNSFTFWLIAGGLIVLIIWIAYMLLIKYFDRRLGRRN